MTFLSGWRLLLLVVPVALAVAPPPCPSSSRFQDLKPWRVVNASSPA